MDINKPNRATLKSYFVKNAIPTAANFEKLIEGMLNQTDDGIVKLPSQPLSVQAEVDAGVRKVINFYDKLGDSNAAWTLCLVPNPDPVKKGFGLSIGDATGKNSRLFIDESTGNVGIGSTTPARTLEIRADVKGGLGPVLYLLNGGGFEGAGAAIDFTGYGDIKPKWPTVRIQSIDDGKYSSHLVFSSKTPGNRGGNALVEHLRISSTGNVGIGIGGGNVGIGTSEPIHNFHVVANKINDKQVVGLFQSMDLTRACLRICTIKDDGKKYVADEGNCVEVVNGGDGRLALRTKEDALNILRNGNVGIGTDQPEVRLDVRGGDMKHNNYHVTTASEKMRIVQGFVDASKAGSLIQKSDCIVEFKPPSYIGGSSCYAFRFIPPFKAKPSFVVTVYQPEGDLPHGSAIITDLTEGSARVFIVNVANIENFSFSFIAIGQPAG